MSAIKIFILIAGAFCLFFAALLYYSTDSGRSATRVSPVWNEKRHMLTDEMAHFSMLLPTDWNIAVNGIRQMSQEEEIVKVSHSSNPGNFSITIYYRYLENPFKMGPQDAKVWLRSQAELKTQRRISTRINYIIDSTSVKDIIICGSPALSWSCRYDTYDGMHWSETLTRIMLENANILVFANGPQSEIVDMQATIERVASSISKL